jgi:hypothetical protein
MSASPPVGSYNVYGSGAGVATATQGISSFTNQNDYNSQNYNFLPTTTYDFAFFQKSLSDKIVDITVCTGIGSSGGVYRYTGSLDTGSCLASDFNNKKVLLLVTGNLTVSGDFIPTTTGSTSSPIFAVQGTVTFTPSVSTANGMFIANGIFDSGSTPLTVNGMLISYGGFSLSRQVRPPTTPSETVIFDPKIVLTLMNLAGTHLFNWQEVAP